MAYNKGYDWKFSTIGGVTRVNIERGDDIAHLDELDQKLWTVLSCPVDGLEFDSDTLKMLDTDNDGKIRVFEIIAAAKWLTSVLNNPDLLFKKEDFIPFSAFNIDNAEGRELLSSAKQILQNLSLKKDSISISDTSDSVAIFSKTRFNGDGVVTENSTDDEGLKRVIGSIISTMGSVPDRSGEVGVNGDLVERFYCACTDYSAWMGAVAADSSILPYGENTEAAFAACSAIKDKMADFFLRCKLISFDNESASALDVSVERIGQIGGKDLTTCLDEIATYPLARVNAKGVLPLNGGINPAWQAAFDSLKSLVLDVDFPGEKSLSEAEWASVLAKFNAFVAWKAAKKGAEVESLGIGLVKEIYAENRKSDLIALIAEDLKLSTEAGAIDRVNRLLHYYRDFYSLLCNFVTFSDFYSRNVQLKAIFQAGTLFIDQRSCELCIKVSDMAKHSVMASAGGMFLIYCTCVSKVKNETMTIAAVMTQGDVNDLKVGKNAIFYDRSGQDWDATVVKIIDNPISIRQAFWSPYRKFGQWCSAQINKIALDKESKVLGDATSKVSAAMANPAAAVDGKKQAFDIAKFAGIFAAIGMAIGYIGSFLVKIGEGFMSLTWWQMPLSLVAIMIVISGPSMLIAWSKLRRRNLAPLLNANGWAVNSQLLLNVRFGALLTDMVKLPKIDFIDPFARKKMSRGKKALWSILAIIVALGITFTALFFTDNLHFIGISRNAHEATEAPAAPAGEDLPVEKVAPATL